MSTAGKAVFLSALTVVMALAAVFLVPVMVFRSMALGMILAVVAVALASLTLLPALLVALGDRVLVRKNTEDADIIAESRRQRWTASPLRRPAAVLTIGLVVIGAGSSSPHSACTSVCPARRSSTRATPAATATTCSSPHSVPAPPHPHSSLPPPRTRHRRADRERSPGSGRRTRRHRARGNGSRRGASHRFDRRR